MCFPFLGGGIVGRVGPPVRCEGPGSGGLGGKLSPSVPEGPPPPPPPGGLDLDPPPIKGLVGFNPEPP